MQMKTIFVITATLILLGGTAFALTKNDQAPLFSLRDTSGNFFFLNNYFGANRRTPVKGVIVNFFSTSCIPCRTELPILNRLVPEFEEKGIKVIIIGWNENIESVQKMLTGLKVDRPLILIDPYGKTGEKYGLRELPLTIVINGAGKVENILYGALPDFENTLKSALNKMK
jgi:thiol-disulfide isomerase/thioredoxin